MDELDRADIDAAGRLADQQHIRIALHLAGQHDLLLVAAGKVRGLQPAVRRTDVIGLDLGLGVAAHGVAVEQRPPGEARIALVAENGVLVFLEGQDEAHMVAILRHMGAAHAADLGRIDLLRRVDVAPQHGDAAAFGPADAGQRLQEFRLAVARDTGDADDLAGLHVEGDVLDHDDAAPVAHRQARDAQLHVARRGRRLVDGQEHAATDHQLGKFGDIGVGGAARRHHLALPHHRDIVGDRHDLAQLVGDQDDRLALVAQLPQHREEMVRLGRGQDAGGLVEDQDVGAAIQCLEDLDPLLAADGQLLDDGVGVDVERMVALQPLQLGPHPGDAGKQQRRLLGAEHDVLDHGEVLDQHEMLVDHADAGRDGGVRIGDVHRLAADFDGAGIGLVEAVDDRHQRRLAGAVLTDDAVDRATFHRQIDALVGPHHAEALVDVDQFDRRIGHADSLACRRSPELRERGP